jgi:hypothetical protein
MFFFAFTADFVLASAAYTFKEEFFLLLAVEVV